MSQKQWDYEINPASVRELVRSAEVVQEATRLLGWFLLYAEQGFLKKPDGLKPGVWEKHLEQCRAVLSELK